MIFQHDRPPSPGTLIHLWPNASENNLSSRFQTCILRLGDVFARGCGRKSVSPFKGKTHGVFPTAEGSRFFVFCLKNCDRHWFFLMLKPWMTPLFLDSIGAIGFCCFFFKNRTPVARNSLDVCKQPWSIASYPGMEFGSWKVKSYEIIPTNPTAARTSMACHLGSWGVLFPHQFCFPPGDQVVNLTLRIGTSHSKSEVGVATALDFLYGLDGRPPVIGLIGGVFSSITLPVASLTAVLKTPHCAYAASSPQLSNKQLYPYFLRTMPPDVVQGKAMWAWIVAFRVSLMLCIYGLEPYGSGLFRVVEEESWLAGHGQSKSLWK